MIVYLWDAPGPDRSACGVSGDERQARQAAEALLRGGHATDARIEAAVAMLGLSVMMSGYRRTGQGWQARLGPRGGITWKPLGPGG